MEESFRIANPRHIPLRKYDPKNDDLETGWQVYHSRKYLRRLKKQQQKRKQNLQ